METNAVQAKLADFDQQFLRERLRETRQVIKTVAALSKQPLVVQYSGGRDSTAMVNEVRKATDNFVCFYMATGLEFHGTVQFVRENCAKMGVKLYVSNPSWHKGNLFKRIEELGKFPIMNGPKWCCRDLKLRPQKKFLRQVLGPGPFYKLEGIRLAESARRKYIYRDVADSYIRPDGEHRGSFEVFPILSWTDDDVLNYLKSEGLPTSSLYKRFGVSGCSWCPFYTPDIYRRVLAEVPDHYDRIIAMEEKLGQPSVAGNIYLRDLKREVLEGTAPPLPEHPVEAKRPCMMMWEGKMVPTCSIYPHIFIDGVCYRCGAKEERNGRN